MADQAIINASPLIFLSRSRHLDLLQTFADEIWVPEPVAAEILHRGQQDITVRAIEQTEWLVTKPVSAYGAKNREHAFKPLPDSRN